MPENLKARYTTLFDEFQAQETREAKVAREADKLETLLQGEAYEEKTGKSDILDEFLQTYESVFQTDTGKSMFEELKSRHKERKKR